MTERRFFEITRSRHPSIRAAANYRGSMDLQHASHQARAAIEEAQCPNQLPTSGEGGGRRASPPASASPSSPEASPPRYGPFAAGASSHREAPLIAGDPRADNTDVYAFVSPDKPDTVTLIANWIPFEEPNGGPNFYPVRRRHPVQHQDRQRRRRVGRPDVHVDLRHRHPDAASQFLYNTGPVTSLDDPDLNYYQTYDLHGHRRARRHDDAARQR